MKTIRVVAAVIKSVNSEGESIVFATQRGSGDFIVAQLSRQKSKTFIMN